MTPETKKTLIYGGVISFAVGAGLYIWSRYESNQTNAAALANDPTAANAAAQAAADAAAQQEIQLSELAQFSSGGGASLSTPSLGSEAPPQDFAHEIASILQAAGIGAPTVTGTPAAPPVVVNGGPAVVAQQPPPAEGPVNGPKPVGPIVSSDRFFSHINANYITTIQ